MYFFFLFFPPSTMLSGKKHIITTQSEPVRSHWFPLVFWFYWTLVFWFYWRDAEEQTLRLWQADDEFKSSIWTWLNAAQVFGVDFCGAAD